MAEPGTGKSSMAAAAAKARAVTLGKITAEDLEPVVGPLRELLLKLHDKTKKRAEDLREHVPAFRDAAKKFRLTPELVAAVVLAEQGDLDTWIGPGVEVSEETTDRARSVRNDDVSIGLGQVCISTVKQHDLLGLGDSYSVTIRNALLDPARNIEATAQYLRIVATLGAKFPDEPEFASDETFVAWKAQHEPKLDLREFAHHASTWKLGHVVLIGSEYTTAPFATRKPPTWKFTWGDNVLRAYQEVLASGIFDEPAADDGPVSVSPGPGPVEGYR